MAVSAVQKINTCQGAGLCGRFAKSQDRDRIMHDSARPWRSVLYIPASRQRALEKARGLSTDAIIFDLEDAVAPSEKPAARDTLTAALAEGGYGPRVSLVRINALETVWGADDLAAVAGMACDGVLVPKVNGPEDVDPVARALPGVAIWVMMETAEAILNAAAIAGHDRVVGFVVGTNDLAKELGTRAAPDRAPLWTALQICVLAARAHGVVVVDGVYNAFRDDEGLRAECAQGRDFGFDGKTLIHPAQLAIANEVFAPTEDEIDTSRRQIEAYEAAIAQGEAVAVVDGKIVENLHVETARAVLEKARAIKAMEAA
jgi:(3S)-malyl-CoA thioesterase